MATATRHLSTSTEAGTKKAKISKESLKEALILFTYLKPYRNQFMLGLVFIALSAFTILFQTSLSRRSGTEAY